MILKKNVLNLVHGTKPTKYMVTKQITNHEQNLRIIDQVMITSSGLGITQLETEDTEFTGRHITVNDRKRLFFGSCSYLGLELDSRLKEKAIDCVNKFGTQFSSSRAYVSMGLYREIENLLSLQFQAPVILAASTTLGHISNLPVLVDSNDVVILDAQVHSSVQMAVQLLKNRNIPVEVLRHSRMDMLEDRIIDLKEKYNKIWYMADGVYSMYGDYAPYEEMMHLVNTYEQFNIYVDDAHGLSWTGKHGCGTARTALPRHPQVFITGSLAKAYGACGGVLVFPNEDYRRRVRNCGSSLIFSGPIQPATLGAAIASAMIQLSDELPKLQQALQDRIKFFHDRAKELELPLISTSNAPIKFIGVGKPGVGYSMVRRLMDKGIYINLSVFPSVSYKNTGLRIPLSLHHTMEDINFLLENIARELPLALLEEQSSIKQIYQAFRIAV
ncbi:MAG TPA: 8-amino-7-oxononanoate synthase [Bacteroidetes bacterium]|nr:8-amino-7-oxononanoate synthase [Bacteroidota bacterium]